MNDIKLPLKIIVTNEDLYFDDCFFENGMIFDLIDIKIDDIYSDCIIFKITFCQKKYKDYNRKLLKDCYYGNIHTPKNSSKTLFTAEEAGCFDDQWSEYIDVHDGENLIEILYKRMEQTNIEVHKNEIY